MTYPQKLAEAFSKQPAFTIADAQKALGGISRAYLNLLMHGLLKKKKLFRIGKGVYSFYDDLQVVGFAFRPFYYGCQEALSIRGLWEQETNPTVITPRKARSGLRSLEGGNYVVRRINRKMFFGFETIKQGEFWVPVSDVEKTLIDLAYFRQPVSMEVVKEFRKRYDAKKLARYLKKSPRRVVEKIRRMLKGKAANREGGSSSFKTY